MANWKTLLTGRNNPRCAHAQTIGFISDNTKYLVQSGHAFKELETTKKNQQAIRIP